MDQQWDLITRGLQEVIVTDQKVTDKIRGARPYMIYWGTAPTGRIHIGYFVPLMKIADFLNAGCVVTILIADLHAFLDSKKTPYELIALRSQYYEVMIKTILKSLGVDIQKLVFIRGTSFQLKPEYTLDMYKMLSETTFNEAKHAGAEIVKQSPNPLMTNLIYPILQALDEEYLHVDAQFGGVDQRKIFMFAKSKLPNLRYKKRDHLMNPMIGGLRFAKKEVPVVESSGSVSADAVSTVDVANESVERMVIEKDPVKLEKQIEILQARLQDLKSQASNISETKMSSSNADSKIDFLDTRKQIAKKINMAYCLPNDVSDNSPLELLGNLVFPLLILKRVKFAINRKEEYGGDVSYSSIESVISDFQSGRLHPTDLKMGLIDSLDFVIQPIREVFEADPILQKLVKDAYK